MYIKQIKDQQHNIIHATIHSTALEKIIKMEELLGLSLQTNTQNTRTPTKLKEQKTR
jgi:hypothetical protein